MKRDITISDAILNLVPNAKIIIKGNTLSGLIWLDSNTEKQPTEEEIQSKIAELEGAEPMRLLRIERDARLSKTDWRATVDYPGTDQQQWLEYRQALRDLPSTQSPSLDENGNLINVTWPEEPV